eukprot:scaffold434_cov186-Pinguiococcus_pyrenoidosus.AAC.60
MTIGQAVTFVRSRPHARFVHPHVNWRPAQKTWSHESQSWSDVKRFPPKFKSSETEDRRSSPLNAPLAPCSRLRTRVARAWPFSRPQARLRCRRGAATDMWAAAITSRSKAS